MSIFLDIGASQLKKAGEELCGDSLEIQKTPHSDIVILSDGLGSGVKANILSQVTVKTAITMLTKGSKIDEVIETLAHTLPICRVRKSAYSTFSIIQVFSDGTVYLAEYDNPGIFRGRKVELLSLDYRERTIEGKTIKESFFRIADGDWIILCSDGVLHAGIGEVWNFGWGRKRVAEFLQKCAAENLPSSAWAEKITGHCNQIYGGNPGDDTSVVVIQARNPRHLTLLIGPPAGRDKDSLVVEKLMCSPGQKVVCGGTTGNIVSRHLNVEVNVDLQSSNGKVPPMGIIPGIDLVTEGTLTLVYALELLRTNPDPSGLIVKKDGASKLAVKIMEADSIHLIVGMAENPAQKGPEMPGVFAFKHQIIKNLIRLLRKKNKNVSVDYY